MATTEIKNPTVMAREQAALDAARRVVLIAAQARSTFVDRDSAIDALTAAICSGEHLILLGPPGTAKSKLVTFFSDAMGLDTFRRVLNPDTTREDLVGPIDPSGLRASPAVWDRCWAGLATCQFGFMDEVGKASNQVVNMLLDAMEERRVTSGNIDRKIPLHLVVGASNETLSEDVEAIWDRFTVRVVVGYLGSSSDFVRLLNDSHNSPTPVPMNDGDLMALRDQAREMAAHPAPAVVEMMVKLWTRVRNVTAERISDRRWKRLLVVAAGRALTYGRCTIDPSDLIVAQHLLWSKVDEINQIQRFVQDTVDEEFAEIQAKQVLVDELLDLAARANSLEERARVSLRARRLLKDISSRTGRTEWDEIRRNLRDIDDSMVGGDD